ncbi:MAG: DUF2062 domain-containing protein, partial [Gammaproteobacteria bacterium]|nr:DUF2062 domain-containing protein [Gammaproteobacteria bacterium]
MPRRFFRKFRLKRDHLKNQWWVAPFDHLLHDPNLWGIRRQTVVPAFAVGLFIAYLPWPGHVLLGAAVAIPLRINLPVTALTTLVSNPVTMGPMYYLAFRFGQMLLGEPPSAFEFEMSFAWLADKFATIWQPLLLGCLLLGATIAAIGYVALDLVWRASIWDYLS